MPLRLAPHLPPLRYGPLAGVLALHALVIAGLCLQSVSRPAAPALAPLYVQFLAAPAPASTPPAPVAEPTPAAAPPRPSAPPAKSDAPRVIAAPAPSASEAPSAPESPAPADPADMTPPAPVATAPAAAPAAAAGTAIASEPATEPPRYDLAYLSNPKPAYPPRSIELGEQGTVVLQALIGADGRVKTVAVKTSSGFLRLDRAALDAVRRWKFQPSRRGDTPVEGVAIIPMPFALQDSP